MSNTLNERLARPELTRVWDELVRRWEASERVVSSITLRDLTDAERQAIADLLGADRLPGSSPTIQVSRLVAGLGATIDELRSALRDLRGPWASRAAERDAKARDREGLWSWLAAEARPLGAVAWAERLRGRGVVGGDVIAFRARIAAALRVLSRLPAPEVPLAGFACDVLGDPHGLDYGSWLSGVVLEAVAERNGAPLATCAEDARRLWATAGVTPDGLSSSVLCLALAPTGDDPLAHFLRACAATFEPVAITMAQLQRWPIHADLPVVYAFENPSMLAEASREAWARPPLICTSGWPNVAAITLLRQLIATGVRVRYHGDFDPKGICIAEMLVARLGVEPWRMNVAEYEARVAEARASIADEVPEASWDRSLAPSMRVHRRAVFEEDVRHDLLAQLRSG